MQTSYANVWGHLLGILNYRPVRVNVASQALSTCMKLISLEGRHPLEASKKDEYYFPSQRLKVCEYQGKLVNLHTIFSYCNKFFLFSDAPLSLGILKTKQLTLDSSVSRILGVS